MLEPKDANHDNISVCVINLERKQSAAMEKKVKSDKYLQ